MNVMAEAHKLTRTVIANAANSVKGSYAKVFKECLKHFHKEYKAMNNPARALALQTIAQFEEKLEQLKITLNGPDAQKYMVTCDNLPINFEAPNGRFWSTVEDATKWNSRQFAEANAKKVVNGRKVVGVAVRVDHFVEWDMQEVCRLINELKASIA